MARVSFCHQEVTKSEKSVIYLYFLCQYYSLWKLLNESIQCSHLLEYIYLIKVITSFIHSCTNYWYAFQVLPMKQNSSFIKYIKHLFNIECLVVYFLKSYSKFNSKRYKWLHAVTLTISVIKLVNYESIPSTTSICECSLNIWYWSTPTFST